MRRASVKGGLRGATRTAATFAAIPWLAVQRRACQRANTVLAEALGKAQPSPSNELEHVLSQLRRVHGVDKLGPNAEAVVSGRGRHLGIGVSWSLRWASSGCFTEEIRGPQLSFKWGHDGQPDSGCWEVDSSGLVRVLECDDHEAVLLTAHVRTGCWLQPHLRDRYDLELLTPPPPPYSSRARPAASGAAAAAAAAGGGSSDDGAAGAGSSVTAGDGGGASSSRGSPSGAAANDTAASAPAPTPAPASADSGSFGSPPASVGSLGTASPPSAPPSQLPLGEEVVVIGLRVKGRKLRVRVLVRRRDWRVLGFDHRLCADAETWELGEWKEWAPGVIYPSSALHKAANGGQHAYLTVTGAAERTVAAEQTEPPPPPLLRPLARGTLIDGAEPTTAAGATPTGTLAPDGSASPSQSQPLQRQDSSELCQGREDQETSGTQAGASPPQLAPPTWFGLPPLPIIPADTSYDFPSPAPSPAPSSPSSSSCSSAPAAEHACRGVQRVPLWRAASGHFLVRPRINGQEGGGYFLLDTGASGFVVTPQAAARLGGSSFGETHAASVSGKVAARFVRLRSWGLGGLAMRNPVLMVMELAGLVRGAPGELAGIVGYDLFRRAVVEVPQLVGPGVATRGSVISDDALGSGFGSGSASDVESGSLSDEDAPTGATPASAATAAAAHSYLPPAAATAAAFGPPPPARCSTPAFGPGSEGPSRGSSRILSGDGECEHGESAAAAARAVPSSATVAAASPSCDSSSSSSSGDQSSSESGSSSDCINSTSTASVASTSGRSSSSSSCDGKGSPHPQQGQQQRRRGGGGGGRSVTARAMRRAAARGVPYSLHELTLHHPLAYGNEAAWDWEPLIMIANLPHVRLRLPDPASGALHSILLMVDSGACGADIMLHARAQRELGLGLGTGTGAGLGAGKGRGPSGGGGGKGGAKGASGSAGGGGAGGGGGGGHYLRGVGQEPGDYVKLQVLELPWLQVAGVRFEQVTCMCAVVGGLDISLYSHGILCGDLLARLPWALDLTHKRIGFPRGWTLAPPPLAPAPAPKKG